MKKEIKKDIVDKIDDYLKENPLPTEEKEPFDSHINVKLPEWQLKRCLEVAEMYNISLSRFLRHSINMVYEDLYNELREYVLYDKPSQRIDSIMERNE